MEPDSVRDKQTPLPQPTPGESQFGVNPGPAQTGPLDPWGRNPGSPGSGAALNPMPTGTGAKSPEVSAPAGSAGYPYANPSDAQPNPRPGAGQHGVAPGATEGDLVNDMPETDPKSVGKGAGATSVEHPFDNPGMGS